MWLSVDFEVDMLDPEDKFGGRAGGGGGGQWHSQELLYERGAPQIGVQLGSVRFGLGFGLNSISIRNSVWISILYIRLGFWFLYVRFYFNNNLYEERIAHNVHKVNKENKHIIIDHFMLQIKGTFTRCVGAHNSRI